MLRRRQINAGPDGRFMRFLSGSADAVRWPLERAAWTFERFAVWPLRERVAGRGPGRDALAWLPPRRLAGAGALAAFALGVVLFGAVWLVGGDSPPRQVSAPAPVALAPPPPAPGPEQAPGPALRGPAPSFDVEGGVSAGGPESGGEADGESAEATLPAAAAVAPEDESSAVISSTGGRKAAPAGPAAMKVARRFSNAFLLYEVGRRNDYAESVFSETATPQLAEALGERPPRQPQGGKVPKARIVNLVPGPRAGRAYTVSVSLLRVDLTTELRLELRRDGKSWTVTDVRG